MQSVRNESEGDYRCLKYLEDYYPPKFTYQDFGSMLTMDFFESDRIADIVAMSGAKWGQKFSSRSESRTKIISLLPQGTLFLQASIMMVSPIGIPPMPTVGTPRLLVPTGMSSQS